MQPNYYGTYPNYGQQSFQTPIPRQNNKVDLFIVPTLEDAKRYILSAGQTAIFKVNGQNVIVEKNVDFQGNSFINYYELKTDTSKDIDEYAKMSDLAALSKQVSELARIVNEQSNN